MTDNTTTRADLAPGASTRVSNTEAGYQAATIQPTASPIGYVTAESVERVKAMPAASSTYTTIMVRNRLHASCETAIYTAPVAPADAVRDARNEALNAAMAECQKRLTINFPSSINPVESCLNAIRALKTPKEPAK